MMRFDEVIHLVAITTLALGVCANRDKLNDIDIELSKNEVEIVAMREEIKEMETELDMTRNSLEVTNVILKDLSEVTNVLIREPNREVGEVQRVIHYQEDVRVDYSDLTTISNVSEEMLENHFRGTALEGTASSFIKAERLYNINALFLSAIAVLESDWGQSEIAREKNNLFGFSAYNHAPRESAREFESYEESILLVAGYLSYNYLEPNGKYYNGTSVDAVNIKYCLTNTGEVDTDWAVKVKQIMSQLSNEEV